MFDRFGNAVEIRREGALWALYVAGHRLGYAETERGALDRLAFWETHGR